MKPLYAINHLGRDFRFEARASWFVNDFGAPEWKIEIYECSRTGGTDTEQLVSGPHPITQWVPLREFRQPLDKVLRVHGHQRLSGRAFRYSQSHSAWVAALNPPIVHASDDADTNALLCRIAARLDKAVPISVAQLDEARTAVPAAHVHDPDVLAAHVALLPPVRRRTGHR